MARIVPDAAVKFTMNDRFKQMFAPQDGTEIGLGGKLLAGGCAGAFKTVLLYPFDIARTRLTADTAAKGSKKLYNGMIDCVMQTAKNEGVAGVYKGMVMSLAGIVPYLGISFTAYDEFKKFLPTDSDSKSAWWFPFAKVGWSGFYLFIWLLLIVVVVVVVVVVIVIGFLRDPSPPSPSSTC